MLFVKRLFNREGNQMSLLTCKKAAGDLLVSGVILMAAGMGEDCTFKIWAFIRLGFAALVAGLIVLFKFSRCPNCWVFLLDRSFEYFQYCPHCGKKINYHNQKE
jgi:hypothetical protein